MTIKCNREEGIFCRPSPRQTAMAHRREDIDLRLDWSTERFELFDDDEDTNFRFDMYNAGAKVGTDSDVAAVRLNSQEERLLNSELSRLRVEQRLVLKLRNVENTAVSRRLWRMRARPVRSFLAPEETARMRSQERAGTLFGPGERPHSSCGFNSRAIISAASRRLFPRPQSSLSAPGVRPHTSMTMATVERHTSKRQKSAPSRLKHSTDAEDGDWLISVPPGSTADKIVAIREMLRKARIAHERARMASLQPRIFQLCREMGELRMMPRKMSAPISTDDRLLKYP